MDKKDKNKIDETPPVDQPTPVDKPIEEDTSIKSNSKLDRSIHRFSDGSISYSETTKIMSVEIHSSSLGSAEYEREATNEDVKLIKENKIDKFKIEREKKLEE